MSNKKYAIIVLSSRLVFFLFRNKSELTITLSRIHSMPHLSSKTSRVLPTLFILIIALIPRIASLYQDVVTPDDPVWEGRTRLFLDTLGAGNFQESMVSMHPGVTVMWINGLAKKLTGLVAPQMLLDDAFYYYVGRLSIAITISILVLIIFLIMRNLFSERMALLAGALIALDPFFIAHSRVLQMDALLASFMALSALSFMAYLKNRRYRFAVFSGIFAGLALLTKSPSIFLVLFIPFLILVDLVVSLRTTKKSGRDFRSRLLHHLKALSFWSLSLILIFFILFPAMWVGPALVLERMFRTALRVGFVESRFFFMGQSLQGSGPFSYYPVILLLRTTPITLIFPVILGVGLFSKRISSELRKERLNALMLTAYAILYTIQMSLPSKKGDRYILPVFLAIDVLAAMGIYGLVSRLDLQNLTAFLKSPPRDKLGNKLTWGKNKLLFSLSRYWFASLMILLVLINAVLYLPPFPHYLAYYNPLLGGPRAAARAFMVGWGEGFYEVAQYLNQKKHPEKLIVSSYYSSSLSPFFKGLAYPMTFARDVGPMDKGPVEYVIFYISQIQREKDTEMVQKYFFQEKPEYVVKINGLDYAWVFRKAFYKIPPERSIVDLDFKSSDRDDWAIFGWSFTETMGTWAQGKESIIGVDIPENSAYEMEVRVKPLPIPGKLQTMDIFLDDTLLIQTTLSSADFQTITVMIPAELTSEEPEKIRFKYKYSATPKELGVSDDTRDLSVLFTNYIFFRRIDRDTLQS